jgi:CRP/FNR family transcriptional regulator/CRP/FNR family cyclic AMP-dependent transcriptional regulator
MRELFRKVPLFSELNDSELDAIVALASSSNVPKKSIVVQEGEIGNALFVILKGSVKISYYASDGREVVLSLLHEGSIFGEMSLLDKQPRSATVSTFEDSRLAQIRQSDFEHLLLDQPQIALKLLTVVVSRLRRTSSVLERISTMDVPHRLYDYIQDYCKRFGAEDEDGYCAVKLQTHQLIADQLSTSRETISRAISALKKEGILLPSEGRGEVRVDMDAIETLLFAIQ